MKNILSFLKKHWELATASLMFIATVILCILYNQTFAHGAGMAFYGMVIMIFIMNLCTSRYEETYHCWIITSFIVLVTAILMALNVNGFIVIITCYAAALVSSLILACFIKDDVPLFYYLHLVFVVWGIFCTGWGGSKEEALYIENQAPQIVVVSEIFERSNFIRIVGQTDFFELPKNSEETLKVGDTLLIKTGRLFPLKIATLKKM